MGSTCFVYGLSWEAQVTDWTERQAPNIKVSVPASCMIMITELNLRPCSVFSVQWVYATQIFYTSQSTLVWLLKKMQESLIFLAWPSLLSTSCADNFFFSLLACLDNTSFNQGKSWINTVAVNWNFSKQHLVDDLLFD